MSEHYQRLEMVNRRHAVTGAKLLQIQRRPAKIPVEVEKSQKINV